MFRGHGIEEPRAACWLHSCTLSLSLLLFTLYFLLLFTLSACSPLCRPSPPRSPPLQLPPSRQRPQRPHEMAFHVSISVTLSHVPAWNMALWILWSFEARGWLRWVIMTRRASTPGNDWDLIEWASARVSPTPPFGIDDHVLLNAIFMHALGRVMHQWNDVDMFCKGINRWVQINAFLKSVRLCGDRWCIFCVKPAKERLKWRECGCLSNSTVIKLIYLHIDTIDERQRKYGIHFLQHIPELKPRILGREKFRTSKIFCFKKKDLDEDTNTS